MDHVVVTAILLGVVQRRFALLILYRDGLPCWIRNRTLARWDASARRFHTCTALIRAVAPLSSCALYRLCDLKGVDRFLCRRNK